jgi:hypothetical protein
VVEWDEARRVGDDPKDYVDYLIGGGQPVTLSAGEEPGSQELAALAQNGGAFDWPADEPELYSADDGESV